MYKALQGHLESPRLWANLIHTIILSMDFQACQHEPCLYYAKKVKNAEHPALFLRQVDDFAVACPTTSQAREIISNINKALSCEITDLGIIDRFNGVDIIQSRYYVKIHNETYIDKILRNKTHLLQKPIPDIPIPMHYSQDYQQQLEKSVALDAESLKQIEKEFGFKYRQGIGEILYALVTCRHDISFPLIKLSQYSTRPSKIHFEALADLYRYLHATKEDGIYYWRQSPRWDLPLHPLPTCYASYTNIGPDLDLSPLLQLDPSTILLQTENIVNQLLDLS